MALAFGCLLTAQPALADFEAAVSAYNKGNYEQAHQAFRSLARTGDLRAHRYLELLTDKGYGAPSGTSAGGGGSIWSSESSGSSSAGSSSTSSGSPWNWIQSSVERGSAKRRSSSGSIVAPSHDSLMASLYFLPADATMIGMQYVARAMNARELEFDLRHATREGAGIVMVIFALFWWFVIVRLVYGIGGFFVRVVRDVARPADDRI